MNRSELLITYGHRILESNQFANAKDQKHHFRTDVASHSINVALFCIAFYQLLSLFHIKLNLATLIIAALAHDLGIIGRREKFSSNYQCLKGHPKDSVAAVREIIPEVDIRVCDAISSHMFPCTRSFRPQEKLGSSPLPTNVLPASIFSGTIPYRRFPLHNTKELQNNCNFSYFAGSF